MKFNACLVFVTYLTLIIVPHVRSDEKEVKDQYENLPYPPVEDQEDLERFNDPSPGLGWRLSNIDHNIFEGKRDFTKPFNVLVAGGGTGEETLSIASAMKQRNVPGQITHLDLSDASIGIARGWAKKLGLESIINFVQGSIYDIASMNFEPFDFIECSGVLHHLEDPNVGLANLAKVLKDDGGMAIMVYATYGRKGVYELREALNILRKAQLREASDDEYSERIRKARNWFQIAPSTSHFKTNERFEEAHQRYEDEEFFDTFMHPQDIAYTVPDVMKWLEKTDLALIDFFPSAIYEPKIAIPTLRGKAELIEQVDRLTKVERYAFTEVYVGAIAKHYFYAAKPNKGAKMASLRKDGTQVPCLHTDVLRSYEDQFRSSQGNVTVALVFEGIPISLDLHNMAIDITDEIDCKRTVKEIFSVLKEKSAEKPKKKRFEDYKEFSQQFADMYQMVHTTGGITLRDSSSLDNKRDEL